MKSSRFDEPDVLRSPTGRRAGLNGLAEALLPLALSLVDSETPSIPPRCSDPGRRRVADTAGLGEEAAGLDLAEELKALKPAATGFEAVAPGPAVGGAERVTSVADRGRESTGDFAPTRTGVAAGAGASSGIGGGGGVFDVERAKLIAGMEEE